MKKLVYGNVLSLTAGIVLSVLTIGCSSINGGKKMGEIREEYTHYDVSGMVFGDVYEGMDLRKGFALKTRLSSLPDEGLVLFEVPGRMKLSTRNVTEKSEGWWDRAENFRMKTDEDGGCRILEFEIRVEQPAYPEHPASRKNNPEAWNVMRIGVPYWKLREVGVDCELVFLYTGVTMSILLDGEKVNENFPVGRLKNVEGEMKLPPAGVFSEFSISLDLKSLRREKSERSRFGSLQFYTPSSYNDWVGDVVLFYHDGLFHVLYLYDRHHHGNRWGGGAHIFHQLTSRDLRNWTEHGPLFELQKQWQSVGTGTMFFHKGKYYLSHGWHTGRVIPREDTATPTMQEYSRKNGGKMHVFDFDDFGGKVPSGAAYAVSDDGIHFEMGTRLFHAAENPSIYTNERGTLSLYCGGSTWEAEDMSSPWTKVDGGFPPCGLKEPMQNTSECPSFFSWNGYKYLVMGGTGFWTAKGDGPYVNSANEGYDIYDGLDVPMVSPFTGNRMLIGGWINGIGWGSCLIMRELIQYPNGRLGMKWVPELVPALGKDLAYDGKRMLTGGEAVSLPVAADESMMYDFLLKAPADGKGRFALRFRDVKDANRDCELQIDFGKERMQMGSIKRDGAFCRSLKTLRESLVEKPTQRMGMTIETVDGYHARSFNFVLEHVDVAKGEFRLRVALKRSEKMRCNVIDVEVGEARTMVSNRPRLDVAKVEMASDCGVEVLEVRCSTFE